MEQYETAHEVLPPGTHASQGPIRNQSSQVPLGWAVHVLPYLDEVVTYKHVDLNRRQG